MGGPVEASFFNASGMKREELTRVLDEAASQCGCRVLCLQFDDDDNIFDVTLSKEGGSVSLSDCEYVHRAVLDAFDRNIEDYALTVGSAGIGAEEADELLKTINE